MKQVEKDLPLSMVTLLFGSLSVPLAFARHLVSLALVLGLLALVFGAWGDRKQARHLLRYSARSVRRARIGLNLAMAGTFCSVVMWILWATNILL